MLFSPYDKFLQEKEDKGRPIRVAIIGAGNLARMVISQMVDPTPVGIRLAVVSNRSIGKARELLDVLSIENLTADSQGELDSAIEKGKVAITDDFSLIKNCELIDVVLDTTGSVEYSLRIAIAAIESKKHLILANAELDSLLGPALRMRTNKSGTVYTNIDGDEPGVALNLIRYLRSVNLKPVAAGNLKGMVDPYRNPTTQAEFAEKFGQNPKIVTSFADGTKLSMEAAIIANATGFKVSRPGMIGPQCDHVNDIASLLPKDEMLQHGIVDYALGAAPHTGAFVVVHEANKERMRYLSYLKMGEGPFYVFYTPYHLPHIQLISTIGRAVAGLDPTVASETRVTCEVISRAKSDLKAGEILDGPGGYASYGVIENSTFDPLGERGLPISLSENCELVRDLKKDDRIRVSDVKIPSDSRAYALWKEMLEVSGN